MGAAQVRNAYNATVAGLSATDNAGRAAAKAAARAETPPIIRGIIEMVRPGLGPRAGSVGHANVSNAGVSGTASTIGRVGTGLFVLSAAVSVYQVATSATPARESFVQGGGMLGGIGGGWLGGTVGSVVPGPGTIAGGVVGAGLGGAGGQRFGGWAYDKLFGP